MPKPDFLFDLERRQHVLEEEIARALQHWSALPRQDLAKMAEALVTITALLMRMSAAQTETVAEPIDVALLSKGDGLSGSSTRIFLTKSAALAVGFRGWPWRSGNDE